MSGADADGGALRRSIATVCLSGTLTDKLSAASGAGFDGVEIFENDLVAAPFPPAELRVRCADLGLAVELYQPFRDAEALPPEAFARVLRRAERRFDVMESLGADTMLMCSSTSPDAIDDDDLAAEQLHTLAERAGNRGLRIAYEALAWGRHVSTWDHSWAIVSRAGHPSLGLCLDSFHVLSRGSDPSKFAAVPADRLFFLQLADAPHLAMNVLEWSRHHRLFPGQGAFDLAGFLGQVLAAGYRGPLSLEVFNDVYRQSDPARTAVDAMRSVIHLEEELGRTPTAAAPDGVTLTVPTRAPALTGHAFAEIGVDAVSGPVLGHALTTLGFTHTGQHRSKPVQRWQQGDATVLLNAATLLTGGPGQAVVGAFAVSSEDPDASVARAEALRAPVLPRVWGPAETDMAAVAAPDGTSVFFARTGGEWMSDFLPTGVDPGATTGITRVDHVGLSQPFDHADEAFLFYRAVLGLAEETSNEFAAPFGLMRSRTVVDPSRRVRLALSVAVLRRGEWAPGVPDPQWIAFATDDIVTTGRALRAAGAPLVTIPDNYYDDLDARLDLDPALLAGLREVGALHDRDAHGEYFHLATAVLGSRVFFEVVQRTGEYPGHGSVDAPIRMAAQRQHRLGMP
ncbi:sugar phosphate isomerase/epimerase and 4-hydroxyphenylpyruvate domain-containing protein [Actinomycetospora sp. TBRC 11914]|uniref:sugar phosphate isomerase/epimerase and 4-hydroxyphenylpyruvate domain-containing protein n=1 Tax=Actinomycetospora sp. TBRC 11914 TaxID=2729387 RepID=UPI00145DEB0F|nr:sugar phosphate isomerase/epimerase and 4-hydroxyphenylpyruvate domain-containing protein [Actinomycetospora sp. TBRC 11914]NMO91546.1 sugar phosphate isomerase/epimerase and 4-hydroxyphenylpyruvate domain-containing protein [Actinomycetospora sp. TBRC 11914]